MFEGRCLNETGGVCRDAYLPIERVQLFRYGYLFPQRVPNVDPYIGTLVAFPVSSNHNYTYYLDSD
jgi:hypothetical protein